MRWATAFGVLVVRDLDRVDQATVVRLRLGGEVQVVLHSYQDVAELVRDLVGLDAEDVVRCLVEPVMQVAGARWRARPPPAPASQVRRGSRLLRRGPSVHRRAACRS
jgi:hypothetical protein